MRPLTQNFGKTIRGFTLGAVALLSIGTAASAQTWEYVYGDQKSVEDGRKRVTAVRNGCDGGGYISVGTHVDADATLGTDVYVVRTDDIGGRIWEYTYDITTSGNLDEDWGRSIFELADGSGFIVTGHVVYRESGRTDAFLLRLDCDGQVLWAYTYGGEESDEWGYDVIETATGQAGEFIVAGWAFDPANEQRSFDAYMFRTDVNGNLLWDQRYDNGPDDLEYEEYFYALTELTPYDNEYGDVIAVGRSYNPETAENDAYVVRASSVDGTVNAAPQGAATYGFPGESDVFYSVIELENPSETGDNYGLPNVVIVGDYRASNYLYAVKLSDGDPCIPMVQRAIGVDTEREFATDVREVTFPTDDYETKVSQWDLVVTGTRSNDQAGDPGDALLLAIDEVLLTPQPATLNGLYNANVGVGNLEEGWSLEPVEPINADQTFGFVICGFTQSDPEGVGDPEDMYLVKTDGFGRDGCEQPYEPPSDEVREYECIRVRTVSMDAYHERGPEWTERDWGYNNCPLGKRAPQLGGNVEKSFDASLAPNPVRAGQNVMFAVTAATDATFDVTITNALGEVVSRERLADADGTLSIGTSSLSAGAYNITLAQNGRRVTVRMIVVE